MNDLIQIYDNNTNETITREMTDKEQAERNAQVAAYKAEQQAKATEAETKEQAKEAAQAKLAGLGLTADDLKALGL